MPNEFPVQTGDVKVDKAVAWLVGRATRRELSDGTINHFFSGRLPGRMIDVFMRSSRLQSRDLGKQFSYSWSSSDGLFSFALSHGTYKSTYGDARFTADDYRVPAGAAPREAAMTPSSTRVAYRYLSGQSPKALQMSRRQAVRLVNGVINKSHLQGIFGDQFWQPVQQLWKNLTAAAIPFSITKTEYEHEMVEGQRVPMRKVWKFEVPVIDERGRENNVYGQVIAAGAGPVGDPMARYDVTAYAS